MVFYHILEAHIIGMKYFLWGLSISPQVWITYIENLLEGIPNRQAYIAIMDDLMLHGLKTDHMQLFKQLLVSLYFTWLKTFSQKMPAFHEAFGIPWKCFPHRRWCNNHHPNEE